MPYAQFTLKSANFADSDFNRLPLDRGTLESISVASLSDSDDMLNAFVEIGLTIVSPSSDDRIFPLASGMVDALHTVNWSGMITLEPQLHAYALLKSWDTTTVRITVKTR